MKLRRINITLDVPVEDNDTTEPEVVAAVLVIGYDTLMMEHSNRGRIPHDVLRGLISPAAVDAFWVSDAVPDDRTIADKVAEVKRATSKGLQDQLEREIRKDLP